MALNYLDNALLDTLTHITEDGSKVVDRKGFILSSGLLAKVSQSIYKAGKVEDYTLAFETNDFKARERIAFNGLLSAMPEVADIREFKDRAFYNMLLTYTLKGVIEDVEKMINKG
jgi:hypothetical protein